MLRISAVLLLILGTLTACGHTPEERLASGALIGGAIGAVVGLASDPHQGDYYEPERHYYEKPHHRRRGHGDRRRHREWDDYDGDCCYN